MIVGVVDKHGIPLMPCHAARARKLLRDKKADVFSMNPFAIRLLNREGGDTQHMEVKIDPGSKTTGLVLTIQGAKRGWFAVKAVELTHRGQAVVNNLKSRSASRRFRRSRHTRYRAARFLNRTRPAGWLPPSLRSRVDNISFRVKKWQKFYPITSIAVEQVRFDLQQLENPEISGQEYQQGILLGYEAREYLLQKWSRTCTYCQAKNIPLQIEHIHPKSRGGTNRINNLCLACEPCNTKKGNLLITEFLKSNPSLLSKILLQAKRPLKDAAAVNTTRLFIVKELQKLSLPVTTFSGGQTKFNRSQQSYRKTHWIDAACVGKTGAQVDLRSITSVLSIQAKGRGSRQMCLVDQFGFPRSKAKSVKRVHGFQTGDKVRLVQTRGKYQGVYFGEVSVRSSGQFDINACGLKISAPSSRFILLSRFDGYRTDRVTVHVSWHIKLNTQPLS